MSGYRKKIDEEFNGILPYHGVFYLSAIANSGERAIEHYERFLSASIKNNTPDGLCFEFFSGVMQAAIISTLLWPNERKSKHQTRGHYLRSCFDPLDVTRVKDKKLRNRIAHLDEYLDDFCAHDRSGEIIDGFIGDIEKCREPHMIVLRMIDPRQRVAVLYNYEFPYERYFESIFRISNEARKMFENGGVLRQWEARA